MFIKIELLEDLDDTEYAKLEEILTVLVHKGALMGVKGGQTIIHFDNDSNFMGVQVDHRPWWRKKS